MTSKDFKKILFLFLVLGGLLLCAQWLTSTGHAAVHPPENYPAFEPDVVQPTEGAHSKAKPKKAGHRSNYVIIQCGCPVDNQPAEEADDEDEESQISPMERKALARETERQNIRSLMNVEEEAPDAPDSTED